MGGGPAGVVDGLVKEKPDGAGVVEPAGAEVEVVPVEAPAKENFGGVCVPPRPPKDGVLVPPPKPPKAAVGLLPPAASFDGLFSPALDVPTPEKFHPGPVDFPASPVPKRLLPVD